MQGRQELSFVPTFSGTLLAWTKKQIHKNAWRFRGRLDYSDLLQEACIKFLICKRKYPRVNTPQHFFSLYRTALHNHFIELSKSVRFEVVVDPAFLLEVRATAVEHNLGNTFHALERAPDNIKKLLLALISEDNKPQRRREHESYKYTGPAIKHGGIKYRETTNEFMCELLDLNPREVNLREQIKEYFKEVL